ncbi:hypothetical protein DFS34DRAFT_21762 [Phlyctochytrium arcticum]|nr:hypothetical protein DFS34DRAFT_21762 [Phlyctochytrium arcticum]
MANVESWTRASSIIKNIWQLADCWSSGDGYTTFDGSAWNKLMTWDNVIGRASVQKQEDHYHDLDAIDLTLFNNVNARAACANRKRYLLATNVGKPLGGPWTSVNHILAESPSRSGYTLLSTNKQIIVIGGQLIGAGNNTVKTSVMNVEHHDPRLQWEDGPDLPYAVNQTSAAAFGENGAILFGGQSEKTPVPLMRLQNNTWSALEAKGTPPSPRLYPCVATSATTMYVYGGRLLNPTAQPQTHGCMS